MLICEAEYSCLGDGSLEGTPHFAFAGTVFLPTRLRGIENEQLANALRAGRSRRVLAAIGTSEGPTEALDRFRPKVFLCDAFDQDSLIVSEAHSVPVR
jgi:hypothetical protein